MTTAIPRVSDTLARIEAVIAALADPRHRMMLGIFRDHWLAEVRNDVPAIMATLPTDRVSYRFDGLGLLIPDYLEFDTAEDVLGLYEGAAAGGLPMAGPFEDERWAFGDWGVVFDGINCAIIRGRALHIQPYPLDPDALYLARWRSLISVPVDVERGLMIGEHVHSGRLIGLDPVDDDAVAIMLS